MLANEVTLERNTTQKTEIKIPRGSERTVSIVALLLCKAKGNPELGTLKVLKNYNVSMR
jgi:hypothetical protein